MSDTTYITRREGLSDEDACDMDLVRDWRSSLEMDEGPAIMLSEWHALVDSDSELELRDPPVDAFYPEGVHAIWSGHTEHGQVELVYVNGSIVASWPDSITFSKLRAIARKLDAAVISGDGLTATDNAD